VNGIIPNLNNLERKKKASQEIYQIYCSHPNLEFWFNGITLAYMTTNNHHNLRIQNRPKPTLYTPHKILLMSTTKVAAAPSTWLRRATMLLEQLPTAFLVEDREWDERRVGGGEQIMYKEMVRF
jgi:hypothetical protein